MKIRPTSDMVLLKPSKGDEKTKGGIVLPDEARGESSTSKCVRGEVLATGPGRLNERYVGTREGAVDSKVAKLAEEFCRLPLNCKPGDVVLFERGIGGGYEIQVDGEKLYMCRDGCVVAVLEPAEA